MGDDDSSPDDELYQISTSVDILQDFLGENKNVLTLIGVFSAITVYFQQDSFVTVSTLASDLTLFSGVGIVSLLFIVISYNITMTIFDNGGPGIPANILLVVFFILLLSFIIPTFQYIGNLARGVNTIGRIILLTIGVITFISGIFKLRQKSIYSKASDKYSISEENSSIIIFILISLQYYIIDGILTRSTDIGLSVELGSEISSVWAYVIYHISLSWSVFATGILALYLIYKIKFLIEFVKAIIVWIYSSI